MNLLHRATFIVRKTIVIIIGGGIVVPLALLVYWIAPDDWRINNEIGD